MAEAPQPKPRPIPAPRRNLTKKYPPKVEPPPQPSPPPLPREWLRLLESTEVFRRGEVKLQTIPQEVETAAREYLQIKPTLQYRHLDLRALIRDNKSKTDYLKKIATALEKLFHYAVNLLSPVRPRAWRTIKFATPFFHIHVNPVAGAKGLLMALGYRNDTGRSLEFYEESVPDSDIQKVKEMTAELLVAKLETEQFERRGGPPREIFQSPLMEGLQPPPQEPVRQPSLDIYGEESLRPHYSGEQMDSAMFMSTQAAPDVGQDTFPVPRAEPRTMPEGTVGWSAEQESVGKAPQLSDSDDDDYLEVLRKERASILNSVTSPRECEQEIPQERCAPTLIEPPQSTAAPEPYEEEEKDDDFHTPRTSPTGTGHQSPPLITSQPSPGERQVPEGESNRFQQSENIPRYPAAAAATAAPIVPQPAARVNRPATISPNAMRTRQPRGDEDSLKSYVVLDEHGNDTAAEMEEARRKYEAKKAAEGHSRDVDLKDYVVVDALKEQARMKYEQEKALSKVGSVQDINRMKEEMKKKYEEERLKSGIDEVGALQRKNQIEAKRQELKDSGEFFMHWLKEAMKIGYEPEEVEFAVNEYGKFKGQYRTPLEFLHLDWHGRKMMVRTHIGKYVKERGMQDVGVPSLIEARDCLVECGGVMNEAIALCAQRREEKIGELQKRYPVTRKKAARVLTTFKLNVDVAVRDLEQESLKGIMEFIWEQLDQGEIRKMEENRLEDLVKKKKDTDKAFCHRLLMAEFNLDNWDSASLVFHLMDKGTDFNICLKVARNCHTMEEAEKFMNQECPICLEPHFMDEMVAMLHCQCSVCKDCFHGHYTLMAHEKNISQFNCLVCAQPDLAATDIDKDDYLMLFAVLLKEHVPYEHYQLFQKKAMEFALLKDPNFRWCAHTECGAGFIHDPPLNKVITCPYCHKKMCYDCKRPWEDQHRGISCKDFTKWKAENDEENQQKGLAAFLKENGLECPKCKCRYDLARGGCLHFRCGQCPTDFCGGCGAVYDKACRKYKSCAPKGFHAHHPRDCLFYLRDWAVERLQKMLRDKEVKFDTEAPEAQVNAARQAVGADQEGGAVGGAAEKEEPKVGGAEGQLELRCRVMLQKEVGTERVDEECGDDCKQGHGGLCQKHYKEYLIFKINEAVIDPAEEMDVGELRAVILREEKPVPEGDEKDVQYKERLKEQVKKDIPLEHRGGLNF